MKAYPMIYRPQLVGLFLDQHVASFAICVIDQEIKQCHGIQSSPVGGFECKEMIFRIVFDKLLERARAVGCGFPEDGNRNEMKSEGFTDDEGGHFPSCKCGNRKIPQGLLTPGWFGNRGYLQFGVMDAYKKGVH